MLLFFPSLFSRGEITSTTPRKKIYSLNCTGNGKTKAKTVFSVYRCTRRGIVGGVRSVFLLELSNCKLFFMKINFLLILTVVFFI